MLNKGDNTDKADKAAGEQPSGARAVQSMLVSLLVLVVAFLWLLFVAYVTPSPGKSLSLDQIYDLAQGNRLQSVTLLDEDAVIVGEVCLAAPREPQRPSGRPPRCHDLTDRFHSSYPSSNAATQQLIDAVRQDTGADITIDKQGHIAVAKLLVTFVLPLLMLANLFGLILLSRGSEGGLGEIAGFGRLRRKRHRRGEGTPSVTFADVAGVEEAVTELREVIDYLADPARFEAFGAAPPKGVLLFGPPGCGKTLLARATAGETGASFFTASGTEFVESLVGVGAARVRDLFRQVRESAPAILFIDEIDAVGRRRSGEGTSGGEREQTLNQLLVELDGFEVSAGVVLMGATNRPDILDPALLRPGRFDRHITLETPDVAGRQAILELHTKGRPLAADVDLSELARRTPGFSGADLANVINEAALLAIRRGAGTQISATLLSEAVLRVVHGTQRRGRLLTAEERRRLAIHESGHALVTAVTGHASEIHRVSIVARGRRLAQSSLVRDGDEAALLTAAEMESRLVRAMAGIAAEVLVFGQSSTTSQDDIELATALAKEMVGIYGMSPALGRVRLLLVRTEGFLSSDSTTLDMVSGPTMADFDAEVRRLIADAEATATSLLKSYRPHLDRIAAALEEHETLEAEALGALLAGLDNGGALGRDGGTTGARRARGAKAR